MCILTHHYCPASIGCILIIICLQWSPGHPIVDWNWQANLCSISESYTLGCPWSCCWCANRRVQNSDSVNSMCISASQMELPLRLLSVILASSAGTIPYIAVWLKIPNAMSHAVLQWYAPWGALEVEGLLREVNRRCSGPQMGDFPGPWWQDSFCLGLM